MRLSVMMTSIRKDEKKGNNVEREIWTKRNRRRRLITDSKDESLKGDEISILID